MQDQIKKKLKSIIAQQGINILANPKRVNGLLRDYFPNDRREVRILSMALDDGMVQTIVQESASQTQLMLTSRLSQRLHNEFAMDLQMAQWTIDTWYEVITNKSPVATPQPTAPPKTSVKVDDWKQRLWDWADANNIPDLHLVANENGEGGYWQGFPRDEKDGNLEDLVKLVSLSKCKISKLPPEIGKLTKLKELDLSDNQLTSLPPEIVNLTDLHEFFFDLSDNPLSEQAKTDIWRNLLHLDYILGIGPRPKPWYAKLFSW
jgi:hypothetical protein